MLILGLAGGGFALVAVVGIVVWAFSGSSSPKPVGSAVSNLAPTTGSNKSPSAGAAQPASSSAADPVTATAKKLADEMATATLREDYGRMVDLTFDTVVEAAGGREAFVQQLNAAMAPLKANGTVMSRFVVDDPGPVHSEGNALFVVLPTQVEMSTPTTIIVAGSYLLGISFDQGKTWKFCDGTGINKHPERMKTLLPKLPASLTLPKSTPPVATKKPQ